MYLNSLWELDALQSSSANVITRVNNVDVIQQENNSTIALCKLAYLVPFSSMRTGTRMPSNVLHTIEGAAAVALAANHLNTGDGSVVRQVKGLNQRCNIRFTMESFDTEWSQKTAVDQVIAMTDREKKKPCTILGAIMSTVSMPTSLISGLRGYLQISSLSTSALLDDRVHYPLFARTVPSADSAAIIVIRFLHEQLNVNHLGVVHTNEADGSSYALALQHAAAKYAPTMKVATLDVPPKLTPQIVERTIGSLKQLGYTYFFGVISQFMYDDLMQEAVRQGIAGTGQHNWMFTGGKDFAHRVYERGSFGHLALPGTAMITASGYWPGQQPFDNLYKELRNLTNSTADMNYLEQRLLPRYADIDSNTSFFSDILNDPGFLQSPKTRGIVSWVYDSAIAAGLAACNATASAPDTYFDGKSHFQALLGTTFGGATGKVTFDPITGTREAEYAQFKVINIVEDPETSNSTHARFKEVVSYEFVQGQFSKLEPLVFNDGTTSVPLDLPRLEVNQNHLSTGIRVGGLTMCGLILVLACGFALWTFANRKARVVRSSQPIFLYILCGGAAIMGSSILPLSVDGGVASPTGCNIACMAFPWLLSVGFSVIFSALWAKTHRINKIFQNPTLRRMKVSAFDVGKPMLAFLGANILVLSLWTIISPIQYEVEVVSVDAFDRSIETYGVCRSDDALGYLIALSVINLGPLVFAVYEAYRARHISTEFSESGYIFKALVVFLMVCFIGIPVIVIARDNPTAFYFVFSAIIFVVCTSILLLIFVPKIKFHRAQVNSRPERGTSVPLPRKFARSQKSNCFNEKRFSSSENRVSSFSQNGSSSFDVEFNRGGDSNDESCVGVRILSHPKTQEALQEQNMALIAVNEELRKSLRELRAEKGCSPSEVDPEDAVERDFGQRE